MAEGEIVKEYGREGLAVIWKPKKCIHSEVCVKTLPEVYKPDKKPWIHAGNASVESLVEQIDRCPSGALSYRLTKQDKELKSKNKSMSQKVEVTPNGPLMVHGEIEIKMVDGSTETKKRTTAFCRCGASDNKPFCDGGHRKIEFEDS
ncbi:(4Fe-4S)-binding protein [Muriicola sp.]|uniref:(4Fe-4S)-binding protein n=1 Tax=Muriicola sp. TaxID=2020856 RepID=UPI003564CEF9